MKNKDRVFLEAAAALRRGMLPEGGLIVAAVSGGADSMCLLHILRRVCPASLLCAHYNHGLRGTEADRDEDFVRRTCEAWGIPFVSGRGQVAEEAARTGKGIEETARALRYSFLRETAERFGSGRPFRIATAHNADDQAETVLLHLLRGTGLQGLTGISPVRDELIRPLLTVSRADIEEYDRENNINWVEDSTNSDIRYSRNYLRHEILPLLKEQNPALLDGITRMTGSLRRDEELLERLAEEVPVTKENGEAVLSASALASQEKALQPRTVQRAMALAAEGEILSESHRQAVIALAEGECPSGEVRLPCGIAARRRYDRLTVGPAEKREEADTPAVLPQEGALEWNGWRLTVERVTYGGELQRKRELYLRCDGEITVRSRRTGDEIAPVGRHRKTLKKYMIEEKLPADLRDRVPVLVCGDQLLAAVGIGTDRSGHPAPGEACRRIRAEQIEKERKNQL